MQPSSAARGPKDDDPRDWDDVRPPFEEADDLAAMQSSAAKPSTGTKAAAQPQAATPPKATASQAATPSQAAAPTSIRAQAVGDQPGTRDLLGFEPYVQAMARFLREADPPLTVSIEGKWGSGKSTFVRLLREELRRVPPGARPPLVVEFNPWRHEDAETLWAAFAAEFVAGIKAEVPWRHRRLGDLRLRAYQRWPSVAAGCALALGGVALAGAIVAFSWTPGVANSLGAGEVAEKGAAFVAGTATFGSVAAAAVRVLRDPVERAIARNQAPERQGTFIERLRREMNDILRAYAPDRRVYVLVDDLDRSTRAGEAMRALSHIMADADKVVFVLAMDREKVAASVAHANADVLPYLDPGRGPAEVGLEYGHQYVEKFIQLPFRLPQPGVTEFGRYFEHLTGKGDAAPKPATSQDRLGRLPWRLRRRAAAAGSAPAGTGERPRQVERLREGLEGQDVRDLFTAVAPAMESNPRRLKQFLNLFRLRAYTAAETGLLDGGDGKPALTLPQLAKFVALTVQWPILVDRLDEDPTVLARLEQRAAERAASRQLPPTGFPTRPASVPAPPPDALDRWLADPRLDTLLRLGPPERDAAWSLQSLPVAALLATSPRVGRLQQAAAAGGDARPGLRVAPEATELRVPAGGRAEAAFEVVAPPGTRVAARVDYAPEAWGVGIEPPAFTMGRSGRAEVAVACSAPRIANVREAVIGILFEGGGAAVPATIVARAEAGELRTRGRQATAARPQPKMAS